MAEKIYKVESGSIVTENEEITLDKGEYIKVITEDKITLEEMFSGTFTIDNACCSGTFTIDKDMEGNQTLTGDISIKPVAIKMTENPSAIIEKTMDTLIKNLNIDFDHIEIEQQYDYHRQNQKKQIQKMASTEILNIKKPDNLIGYTWNNVSFWRHEPGKKYCALYDKEGKIIEGRTIPVDLYAFDKFWA